MNMVGQSEPLNISLPALPKGGGSIQGMGEALGSGGPTGQSSLSIPLPISPGRGYAPNLTLTYSSGQGNGCFGVGWDVPLLTIRRRTSKGVPRYLGNDDYLAPNNEVMTPELDDANRVVSTQVARYGGVQLDQTYTVTRYFPCVMSGFDRIEHWQGTGDGGDFWLIHSVDGQLHCLGKTPLSRIADPSDSTKIGQWLLDESCSPNGEHICYVYQRENEANVDMTGQEADRTQTTNRYLRQVQYGNARPYAPLYAWGNVPVADTPTWLFTLIFDYGERTLNALIAPPYAPQQPWPCRKDSFSDYALGFEVRTHRLCHQVLMFHHFPAELGTPEYLVSRLLLRYEQTPRLSRLVTAQSLAYEQNGTVQSIPPLELSYTAFDPVFSTTAYQSLPAFPGWNNGVQYQLVDLYGEGVSGILYQVGGDWRYLAPQRGNDGPDSIGYTTWQSLPIVPSASPEQKRLMDLTGDGRLDWIIAQPGLAGYFTLNPDRSWSHFIPFAAFPTEFLQPSAQLANLVGGGLADLALIGPRSVRLYPNRRADGFGPPMNVAHGGDNTLPVFDADAGVLVAFSDVLGSGQSHLVCVRYDSLTCWPDLGWGRFGVPLVLATLPFDPGSFDPARVFLADIDGSGATDLIYAESDRFLIFLNQSGNGFDSVPCILPMPPGITYDRLDQVSFADMDGTGTVNLVLTVSHMVPSHWCYSFSRTKPYLLEQINNNMGAQTTLSYRSSAQEWLDQKQADPVSVCHLPFPLPLLSGIVSLDEVSGNTLTQRFEYREGVYAGADREFRGFGFVQQLDTDNTAASTAENLPNTAPALTKIWYHTGAEDAEVNPATPPYTDPAMFTLGPTRFTTFNASTQQDDALGDVDAMTRYQLCRALTGRQLRMEVYGVDDSPQKGVPYLVTTSQYQVRLVQRSSATHPYSVAVTSPLAELSVNYDRIASDPQVHQTVVMQRDAFCIPLSSVAISYARRPQPTTNPYPPTVPNEQWSSTYDSSQQDLRLIETRQSVYNLIDPQVWRLGLPYQQRQNVITNPSGYTGYPADARGLDYEALHLPNGVLGSNQTRILAGQGVTYYFNEAGTAALPAGALPPPLALVHHIETAELDEEMLQVYSGIQDLPTELTSAGYRQQSLVLPVPGESPGTVWAIPHSYTTYVADGQPLPFWLPRGQKSTLIVGPQSFTYDNHYCVVTSVTDAVGLATTARYDYRFLTPWEVTDANENRQQVLLDALGRVLATAFFGTQLAPDDSSPVLTGFAPVSEFNAAAPPLHSITTALADPVGALQQAATVNLVDRYSWMGQISAAQLYAYVDPSAVTALWQALQAHHLITAFGHLLAKGRRWASGGPDLPGIPAAMRTLFNTAPRSPVHGAGLSAQQFALPSTPETQQIQIVLAYGDGFGRPLQSLQKTVPGPAYVVGNNGQLVLDDTGQPLVRDTAPNSRWLVSGRVDYNNKGLPVRRYQPYFVDQPCYVNDASIQQWGYADTLYYDPLGREREMVTSLGYVQRSSYYPWFTVAEDLNDTLHEVLGS
ncbi:SpvB/TcaC N-terminal domain-containing protein [Burkholderia sp. S-53]|uniref:SpvB/TcaC N-terminal domain-containing protein n=1 Tax=Burkholderia sp. S-53 TaxID=2906514 RepID=UPI0021D14EA2|nr:SpvB/TcaC N-terminal domain-containing protein [Burkholderia sp. S-53]UXU86131.1 insecticidal toxin complex [Burkholderia sp. S-53]